MICFWCGLPFLPLQRVHERDDHGNSGQLHSKCAEEFDEWNDETNITAQESEHGRYSE